MDLVLTLHRYHERSLGALSAAERRRARATPAFHRADWAAGRVAARAAARLAARDPAAHVVLSVSHRDGRAAAVAARSGRVGVDLDRAGAIRREHVRYFADRHEQAAWRRADPTALWALKEAAWKALRLGPEVPFSALQLRFGRGGELIRVRHAGATYSARAALGRPWPGYLLAVVQLGERA